jgi:DNA-binding helix-turn-helix protein
MLGGEFMYPNLNAELARQGWTRKDLANKTGIRYQTLNEKLNGKRPFTFPETVKIKKALSTNLSLEQIFLI